MKIAASNIDGILIVTLGEGHVVASNVEQIRAEIEGLISATGQKVVLDLGPVVFLDSSGLGLLVAIMKMVNRAGGVVRVAGLGPQPLALFRTVNLDRVMPLSRDVEEALTSLRDARAGARKVLERKGEHPTAEAVGGIEQIVAHTRLSYAALFGPMPETLSLGLRNLLERDLLSRQSGDETGVTILDGPLETRKRQILGEMAQGMAGRFKNVLTLVIGRIQFLRMITTDEKVCGSLDIMERASLQGMASVRRVEEFSQGSAMRRMERLPVRRLLDEALEMVRIKRETDLSGAGKPLRFIREFVGSPVVMGCEVELKHAFIDVLLNAMEAMPDGGVLTVAVNQSNETVTMTIGDTGRGMGAVALTRAFDPQFSTKGAQGAGLGLPIARAVLEMHAGSIVLESQEARGTTATINLPAALAEAGAERTEPEPAAGRSAPASGRVLVVDDEAMVCDLLKDILGTMGCDVIVCLSGREGLASFAAGRFDLVMTDLAMPGMNGWEVAREIRSRDAIVPVALFSAWGSQQDVATMRERGVDFLFPKPFEISMIRNVLVAALDLGRSRRSHPQIEAGLEGMAAP